MKRSLPILAMLTLLFATCATADEIKAVAVRATKSHDVRLAPELSLAHQSDTEYLGLTQDNRAVIHDKQSKLGKAPAVDVTQDLKSVNLLVGYRGKRRPAARTLKAAGLKQLKNNATCSFLKVQTDGNMTAAEIQALLDDPNVLYVEPDYILSIPDVQMPKAVAPAAPAAKAQEGVQRTPNDPSYGSLWGMTNINAPTAWDAITNAPSVIVAVIDTGVDYNHPDLAGNMWRSPTGKVGYDYYSNDDDPRDEHFHGTHVAGTIAAVGNNAIGVTGVMWQAKIMALRFLGPTGSGDTSDAIDCINFAVNNGAHVLNNSWGGGGYSAALDSAIGNAAARGVLFVAAAGNDNSNNNSFPHYPSNYSQPNVVSVGAIDISNNRASFSNYGSTTVDLGAPGVGIYSTFPTYRTGEMNRLGLPSNYHSISGTSMATPHVSGAMGLAWAKKYAFPLQFVSQMNDVRNSVLQRARPVSGLTSFWGNGSPATVPGGVLDIAFLGAAGGVSGMHYHGNITYYTFSPFSNGQVAFDMTFNPGGTTNYNNVTWSQSNYGLFATVQTQVTDFFLGPPAEVITSNGYAFGTSLFMFGYDPSAGLLIWNGTSSTPIGSADSLTPAASEPGPLTQLGD